ncbi:MAG: hypothetical protein Kow00124_24450 [Anaerolineae bacterium]
MGSTPTRPIPKMKAISNRPPPLRDGFYVLANPRFATVPPGCLDHDCLADLAGARFHYNSDFSASVRFASIVDPASAGISKTFVPSTINPGGVSTLVFTLSNPNGGALSGYSFADNLPAGMQVANPPNATTSGCGTPTFAPTAGATTISFANGTVAGNSTCTASVNVTASTVQTYTNTSEHLFVSGIDTGKTAAASLVVTSAPPPPACTPGIVLARWTMDPAQGTGTPPAPSYVLSSRVDTATASFVPSALPGTQSINTAVGNPVNAWSGTGWPLATAPVTAGPGPNTTSYFQFVLDTSNFTGGPVGISIDVNPTPTGNWAAPGNITVNVHASADGGAFSTIINQNPVPRNAWTTLTGSVTPGSSTTTFRVNISGRSNGAPAATFLIDNIVFTGCGIPDYPALTKSFSPDPIAAGGVSRLTFTLANPNGVQLTGAAFSDTLPAGMAVAAAPNASTTCGGTWTPTSGSTTLTFSGGAIGVGGACTVSVDVTAAAAGAYVNTSGSVSHVVNGQAYSGNIATATLTVNTASPTLAGAVTARDGPAPGQGGMRYAPKSSILCLWTSACSRGAWLLASPGEFRERCKPTQKGPSDAACRNSAQSGGQKAAGRGGDA